MCVIVLLPFIQNSVWKVGSLGYLVIYVIFFLTQSLLGTEYSVSEVKIIKATPETIRQHVYPLD